jgi:hypothetical protein
LVIQGDFVRKRVAVAIDDGLTAERIDDEAAHLGKVLVGRNEYANE